MRRADERPFTADLVAVTKTSKRPIADRGEPADLSTVRLTLARLIGMAVGTRSFTLLLTVAAASAAYEQQPTFRSELELVRLDVAVVTANGTPVRDLQADDFDVEMDGEHCRVRTLQFLDLQSRSAVGAGVSHQPPVTFSTNSVDGAGRLTIIAVDTTTLAPGRERALLQTLAGYVRGMGPSDSTALLVFPNPSGKGRHVEFTTDTQQIQSAVSRIAAEPPLLIPSREIDVTEGETPAPGVRRSGDVNETPRGSAGLVRRELTTLAEALIPIDGPKTLILISGGISDGQAAIQLFAEQAARARLTVYVVRPFAPGISATSGSNIRPPDPGSRELELLVGETGGALFDAVARPRGVFDRLERETSGLYVLGVEPATSQSRKRAAKVSVRVRRTGTIVRSPRQFVPVAQSSRHDPRAVIEQVVRQPRLKTDVALRVATHTVRGAEGRGLKTVVLAEVGQDSEVADLAWGFEVLKGEERVAKVFERKPDSGTTLAGRSALTSAVSLPPGAYTLRLAVVAPDGRRGSVVHPFVVGLHDPFDSEMQFSDLLVGYSVKGRFTPSISVPKPPTLLAAFVEVYAGDAAMASRIDASFSLVGSNEETLFTARGAMSDRNGGKRRAQGVLPLPSLAPGGYTVVATIFVSQVPVLTLRQSVIVS